LKVLPVMSVHRILVPVDFSDCSMAAIEWAADLARHFDAVVDVLHVVEPIQHYYTPDVVWRPDDALDLLAFERGAAGRSMKQLLQVLDTSGTPARGRLEIGDARHTILKVAEQEGHDLIVMGTHGKRGVTHILHGRTAAAVVKRALCPVLTVRRSPSTGRARFIQSSLQPGALS
jgi:nucleotide-binding universal stress UspA family protein